MTRIVTFGEIMMRLSPPDHQLISQARSFDVVYGGGESNVAVSLAHFGMETAFVTRLPSNPIGKSCRNYLRQFGVETKQIIWGGSRLGIYFLEHGAGHRGSNVVYDRGLSALAEISPGMVDWDEVFDDASWFHWTGITPAISEGAAAACIVAVEKAKENGLTVSCDLNYRSKLWMWGKEPGEVMPELLRNTDIAIGNEEDAEKVFSIFLDMVSFVSIIDCEKGLSLSYKLLGRRKDGRAQITYLHRGRAGVHAGAVGQRGGHDRGRPGRPGRAGAAPVGRLDPKDSFNPGGEGLRHTETDRR